MEGWYVKETHGSKFQSGLPDLFATHPDHGMRWIEVKLPNMKGSRFTSAQWREFPLIMAHGTGIWILTAATTDEYRKLFQPYNAPYFLLEKS